MKAEALVGSTLREIGILLLVFGPLELYLRGPAPSVAPVAWLAAIGLILIAVGITMELRAEAR